MIPPRPRHCDREMQASFGGNPPVRVWACRRCDRTQPRGRTVASRGLAAETIERRDQIVELVQAGHTRVHEIARAVPCSYTTAWQDVQALLRDGRLLEGTEKGIRGRPRRSLLVPQTLPTGQHSLLQYVTAEAIP